MKKILPELLKTRVYVGISAGSMVATKNLVLSDSKQLYSESIGDKEQYDGLGFVDFHIRPHLNNNFFPNVTEENLTEVAKTVSEPIYALDDNSAIKVVDGRVEIVSEGKWIKFN